MTSASFQLFSGPVFLPPTPALFTRESEGALTDISQMVWLPLAFREKPQLLAVTPALCWICLHLPALPELVWQPVMLPRAPATRRSFRSFLGNLRALSPCACSSLYLEPTRHTHDWLVVFVRVSSVTPVERYTCSLAKGASLLSHRSHDIPCFSSLGSHGTLGKCLWVQPVSYCPL